MSLDIAHTQGDPGPGDGAQDGVGDIDSAQDGQGPVMPLLDKFKYNICVLNLVIHCGNVYCRL